MRAYVLRSWVTVVAMLVQVRVGVYAYRLQDDHTPARC